MVPAQQIQLSGFVRLALLGCLIAGYISSQSTFAQGTPGDWAWMGGSDVASGVAGGHYGTEFQFGPDNFPPARISGSEWTDAKGRLWLFGGSEGFSGPYLNDVWAFDPALGAHGEWAWMGGTALLAQPGIYGTEYLFAAGNKPGARISASHWTDSNGRVWMFGGFGYDSAGNLGALNDVWVFDEAQGTHGEWAWMGGPAKLPACGVESGCAVQAVYGTEYQFAPANDPGGRYGAQFWTGADGKVWLSGGEGIDSAGRFGYFNDLWVFDPAQGPHGAWAWIGGESGFQDPRAIYGVKYQFAPGNYPGYRIGASTWTDKNEKLWLFGGATFQGAFNDLWVFDPTRGTHGEWAWMSGYYGAGTYGTEYQYSPGNIPGERQNASAWTSADGRLWLFGGSGYATTYGEGGDLNDLWVFDPERGAHGQWAWMSGAASFENLGLYGTEYQFGAGNSPGSREPGQTWTDANGNFWLFGGWGYDSASYIRNVLSDLWEFVPPASLDQPQSITFAPLPASATYGDAPITLTATASSGLPVAFSVLSGPAKTSGTNGSTLTLIGGGAEVVVAASQWGNSEYAEATQVKQSFSASKAPLTVQADNKTMPQGGQVPALTWTASGFVNGDTAATSLTGAPALTTTATSASALGTYPILITAGTLASNKYLPQWKNGALTVLGSQTISFPALPALTYGMPRITLSATASSGLPVSYKLIAGPATLNGDTLTITGGGAAVVVSAYQPGNSEYSPAPLVQQGKWVLKAPLSVTADNKTMTYGQPVPALTWTAAGFVNADTASSALTGAPTLSTIVTSTTPPGTYEIRIAKNTLSAANYTLGFKWATITVAPLGAVAKPGFTLPTGTYTGSRKIAIKTATTGAPIYYTTDGSTPSPTHGTMYTGVITVSASETINAIAVKRGYTPSAVASVTYTIQ